MKAGRYGILFKHKGDEVYWVWWWRRKNRKKKFYSTSFQAYFSSLEELDEFWDGYIKSIRGQNERRRYRYEKDY